MREEEGGSYMDQSILEEILGCPALPTLPVVAVEVIDLTEDPDVSMSDLAATIQNDQALTAKILRTVNSSFYGLRQQCATIDKALILLGLSPVKSLALGFSLVSGLAGSEGDGFDYIAYWRRGIYSAVGAKAVAHAARVKKEDEAFYQSAFGPLYPDGLTPEQAEAVRIWCARNGIESVALRPTLFFSFWIFLGFLMTRILDGHILQGVY